MSAAVTVKTTEDNADAQAKAIKQANDLKQNDLDRQQQQLTEQRAAEANALAMRQREDMAAFDVIAGENGGGITSQRGLASLGIQQGQDTATLKDNGLKQSAEIGYAKAAASTGAASKLSTIQQPSYAQAGLSIASAGVSYGTAQSKYDRKADTART
ncbi:hypothetical protein GNX71_18590 [Variovorax sp. RKNM96]|uniref:virion core protein, T7 gp14 family n=1 Tax=Variovorax sp. RKNM96 TaxID=2681552 RepID=UPI001981F882|nr:hypothetical protein [Variovorax sp. RKNM96]QSI31477.1 hypothetical protein GNX71_18590 [Variovorax sp. RKNM96]